MRPRDHKQGPADAPVTLVEFGDYQCPYCGEAYYVVKELQRRLGSRLRFVFRNFPLVDKHRFALMAAEAAEAAGEQGKFWKMHDLLYEHQDRLTPRDLLRYAEILELDMNRFEQDLESHRMRGRIEEDVESGIQSGVDGTPTFYLNGALYTGEPDLESLLEGINELLAQPVP